MPIKRGEKSSTISTAEQAYAINDGGGIYPINTG
jgi:hypothetical protein